MSEPFPLTQIKFTIPTPGTEPCIHRVYPGKYNRDEAVPLKKEQRTASDVTIDCLIKCNEINYKLAWFCRPITYMFL